MPPKAKPKAPPSDADVPVTSSIHRKTRKMPKNGETSDVESRPAKVGKKTRNQKMASSKTKDSDTGEISKAASSVPYEESDSRISPGTGSERGETPARELAHAEESWETHAMQSEALESSAYETAPPEEPRETPETDFTFPETPGAPDPKWKPRISLHAIPTLEPGSLTPRAGMYSQLCCVT